jgi:putative redox protein
MVKVSIGDLAYLATITTPTHIIYADEPAEKGGSDTAPAPKELLLASLGSCTCITLSMYAKTKQWPLEKVEVKLEMEESDNEGLHQTLINRQITLTGNLSDEQHQRLLHVANVCPVHKILTGNIHIDTQLTT